MEKEYIIQIKSVSHITHDVRSFLCTKPTGYNFVPGQATEVSIRREGWETEKRPFTFTSLQENPELEFTIKIYNDHEGVTNQLNKLEAGDQLVIREPWGAIEYKGPGYFIAGGAGITPFIAILRDLHKQNKISGNKLFFSNKTDDDIILEKELHSILGKNAVFVISDKPSQKHLNGIIDEKFLRSQIDDFSRHFYLCGPPKMVKAIEMILVNLGASPDAVVFEK